MAIGVINNHGHDERLLVTAVNFVSTYSTTGPSVGDIVVADTSGNWAVNTGANNATPTTTPMGEVLSVEKDSRNGTVRWWNVNAYVTKNYSTVMSRGSNIILANDDSTVTGSATVAAPDRTYVIALDTGNTTCTFLLI